MAFSAFIFSFIEVVILKANSSISLVEHGVLELSQVILLVGIVLMYLIATIKNNGDEKWISLCFVGIFYLFLLRELGVKHMDVPSYIKYIFHGTGRTITTSIIILSSIIGALLNYKHYVIKTIELLFSKRGLFLWGAFAFLQVGQWMEKVDIPYTVLYEESFELIAYCLLLLSAYKTLSLAPLKNTKAKTIQLNYK